MRPDKHKAKKSASYRKGHHGRGKKSPKEKQEEILIIGKPDDHQPQGQGQSKDLPRTTVISSMPMVSTSTTGSKNGSGLSTAVTEDQSSKYSKRKIESNWRRYDIPIEDLEEREALNTKPRGLDFQSLIMQTGGASEQFRFKDDPVDFEDDETQTEMEAINKLFTIDFKEVAECLKATPLHKRLDIPEKYFEKDMLDRIIADAAYHSARLKEQLSREKCERAARKASDGGECTSEVGFAPAESDCSEQEETVSVEQCSNRTVQTEGECLLVREESQQQERRIDSNSASETATATVDGQSSFGLESALNARTGAIVSDLEEVSGVTATLTQSVITEASTELPVRTDDADPEDWLAGILDE